jgi:hypothetical protein
VSALRIFLWKLRYGWRIWRRSHGEDVMWGHYWRMCFGVISDEGWRWHLECNDKDVSAALNSSAVEAADEELSCWTD